MDEHNLDGFHGLTHLDSAGAARMVDVSAKAITQRIARASANVFMRPQTLDLIVGGRAAKGDVLAAARLAGIMAAKRTGELIPLCHPLPLESVAVELTPRGPDCLRVMATAVVSGRTGVEMEALTAASVAALTIYDMCKAVDRGMVVSDVRLEEKSGGRSGRYLRSEGNDASAAKEGLDPSQPYCRLTDQPLSLQEAIDAVSGPDLPSQGGVATFTGVVRNHNLGKDVIRLEYESYPKLVLNTLAQIIHGIQRDITDSRVAIIHRDGSLSVGDAAVVIAASAPHRAEAFDACRRAIEELKKDVPIWKKEISPSGEEWLGMRP